MTESNDVNQGLSQKMYPKSTQCQVVSVFFLPHLCPLLPYHELHLLFERALAMQPNRCVYHGAYYNVLWCIPYFVWAMPLPPLLFMIKTVAQKWKANTRSACHKSRRLTVDMWMGSVAGKRREPGERRVQMDQCLFSIWLTANFVSCASGSAATVQERYWLLGRTAHEEMYPNHLLMHETNHFYPFFHKRDMW